MLAHLPSRGQKDTSDIQRADLPVEGKTKLLGSASSLGPPYWAFSFSFSIPPDPWLTPKSSWVQSQGLGKKV